MLKPHKAYSHKRRCEERICFTLDPQMSLMLHTAMQAEYAVPPPPEDYVWLVLCDYLATQVDDRGTVPMDDEDYIHVRPSVLRRAKRFLEKGQ